jgi:hypothetical protein
MTTPTRVWLHGLGAAFIGASASSVGAILVAPDRFNLTTMSGLRNVILSSGLSGLSAAALYLKSSPLPPLETKTTVDNPKIASDGTASASKITTETHESS